MVVTNPSTQTFIINSRFYFKVNVEEYESTINSGIPSYIKITYALYYKPIEHLCYKESFIVHREHLNEKLSLLTFKIIPVFKAIIQNIFVDF